MNPPHLAATALSAAIGLALAVPAGPAFAQGMANPPPAVKQNMERMAQQHLEKWPAPAADCCAMSVTSMSAPATTAGIR